MKGSAFEREICKQLSRWWSHGERDDIFWRSSQSGGRATQRSKKGLRTFGCYGDITAVDPIGQPLLQFVTIELKRGRSHGSPGDLLDFKANNEKHPFVQCLKQAERSAMEAGSKGWALICRRDHRRAVIYLNVEIYAILRARKCLLRDCPKATFSFPPRWFFVGYLLEDFLQAVSPEMIVEFLTL